MESEIEIWKDIIRYEGLYQVSNHGRVKSLARYAVTPGARTAIDRILKYTVTHRGYRRLELNKSGKGKKHVIHRLVAIAFLDNPDCKPEVNHIDGNKENNHLYNLEWSTSEENKSHAFVNGLSNQVGGEKHVCAKLTQSQVQEIRLKFASGQYRNQTKVAKTYNVSRQAIWSIMNNVNWKL
jgi:hypothetical protein